MEQAFLGCKLRNKPNMVAQNVGCVSCFVRYVGIKVLIILMYHLSLVRSLVCTDVPKVVADNKYELKKTNFKKETIF